MNSEKLQTLVTQGRKLLRPGENRGNVKLPPKTNKPSATPQGQRPPSSGGDKSQSSTKNG